jgi:hypothetical protein
MVGVHGSFEEAAPHVSHVSLTGMLFFGAQVLRPWCHFELPDSDYISAGQRNPELPGPSGVVEPLDPATKVN